MIAQLQQGAGRVAGREKQLRENRHRSRGVDLETEAFDGGADQAGERHPPLGIAI